MYKKIIISIVTILVLLNLAACNNNKKINEIAIINNSFKVQYRIDERIDYNQAKLLVYYDNNTREVVPITEKMISGFDSSTASISRTMTITYKGYATYFMYSVSGDATSSARVTYELENNIYYLKLQSNGETESMAIKLEIYTKEEDIGITKESQKHGIAIDKGEEKISIVVYAIDGISPINGVFLEITAALSQDISVKNILISDGYNDYILPDIVLSKSAKK